jgi:hypothetical protein
MFYLTSPVWVNFGVPYIDWKMLVYFMAICNISRTLGIFYDQMVHVVLICYIFSGFGIMHPEKSGNPGHDMSKLALVCFHAF